MLVLSIPLSLYLAVLAKRGPTVWLYRIHVAIAASAVLLTASRGPFLASFGALLFIPASFSRWTIRQKAALFLVIVIGVVAAAWIVPASSWKRLGSIEGEIVQGTLNDRKLIWKAGYEMFREHPVLGVGAGAFLPVIRHTTGYTYVAHNTFLSIAAEQGLVGFAIFLALILNAFIASIRMPKLERGLWLAVLLAMMIGILSLTWEYRKPIWLIFGLISLQAAALNRRKMRIRPASASRVPLRPPRIVLSATPLPPPRTTPD
jgi:O-antigen ligase